MSSSSVAAAADAVGRGAAGGFPPAAAEEPEDPLWAPLFFTMMAVVELSFLSASGGGRSSLFLSLGAEKDEGEGYRSK